MCHYSLRKGELCTCGCGEYALFGNKYIWEHKNIGSVQSSGTCLKRSLAQLGVPKSKEHIEKVIAAKTGKSISDTARENISHAKKLYHEKNPEWGYMHSQRMIVKWQDSRYRNLVIHNTIKGSHIKPTAPERRIIDIIKSYSLPFKYNGDKGIPIAGKCPDFISNNGQECIVEIFGDYWHEGENEQELIEIYAKCNYRTLILWESEMKEYSDDYIMFLILGLLHPLQI